MVKLNKKIKINNFRKNYSETAPFNITKKAQGSTEYLVIIVVVLVIALIVIGLLGGFTGFGSSANIQQSQTYWKGTTPFSVEELSITTNEST